MKSFVRQLDEAFDRYEMVNENHLGIDELNYIEVSIRDARLALEIYADIARNYQDIVLYGSNVYASNNAEELSDLLSIFDQQAIEINEEQIDNTDLDEQNVTGAIAGYNVPGAFTTAKKFKKKKFTWSSGQVNESAKPVSKKYVPGHYQLKEFDEEVQTDKFIFSLDEKDWWNKEMQYPSKDITNTPGTVHKKDLDKKTNKSIDELLDKKYEQLIEGYRDFKSGDIKPSTKVKSTIQEIAKKLQEIETLVNYNSKLKEESGVTSTAYGPGTQKALTKISERLLKISERVRSLGA